MVETMVEAMIEAMIEALIEAGTKAESENACILFIILFIILFNIGAPSLPGFSCPACPHHHWPVNLCPSRPRAAVEACRGKIAGFPILRVFCQVWARRVGAKGGIEPSIILRRRRISPTPVIPRSAPREDDEESLCVLAPNRRRPCGANTEEPGHTSKRPCSASLVNALD